MSGTISLESYWNDDRYNTASKLTSSANSESGFGDSSVFTGQMDTSSGYESIIDSFEKTLEENAAAKEKEEAEAAKAKEETEAAKAKEEAEKAKDSDKTSETDKDTEIDKTEESVKTDESDDAAKTDEPDGTQESEKPQGSEDFSDLDIDPDAIAASLHKATKGHGIFGWGTNEEVVEKYLGDKGSALSDKEIRAVAQAYENKYGHSLEDMIKGDFSFSTEDKYLAKIKNANEKTSDVPESGEEHDKFIKEMASKFYDATVGQWGTNEEDVWQVMTLDPKVLKEVISYYNDSPYADEKNFEDAIKGDFSIFSGESRVMDMYNKAMGNK